jgi:dGTPase
MTTYADRKRLETLEAQTLARYAHKSANSRGRVHHEPEPQYRTAFQRDRDRITHSAAFRRLEYKTQVFVNDLGDYYRTRLTHTLEVTQIGRTISRALAANEDLVETICLAHDLGHPPFGHAGEQVLNGLMSDYGGFNHNHQSYRVVTELERRYERWRGLNLTYETLDGIAKHETDYDVPIPVEDGGSELGSLEAQIADIADALAYNAHDLDDGLTSGLITPAQLTELEIWKQATDRSRWDGKRLDDVSRHHLIREIVGLLVDDLLTETGARLTALEPHSPEVIQLLEKPVVGYTAAMEAMLKQLKDFLYEHMYYHYRVMRMSQRAEHFITQIFKSYVSEPRQLPDSYQQLIPEEGVHRVVADYIASLTDRSAQREYQRLFDPNFKP